MSVSIHPAADGPSDGVPYELTHGGDVDGRWWICFSPGEAVSKSQVRGGEVDFRVLDDGRLAFSAQIELRDGKRRRADGIAAAHADDRGLYRWSGKGFVRLVTWLRWGYLLTPGRSLLMVAHPGSPLSRPTSLLLARESVTEAAAAAQLRVHGASLGLGADDLRELVRHPRPLPVGQD